jgi:Flp pilus assembly protein TadG
MSIQLLVILVPVLFGMMGFAIDLGRLWLIRGELHQAASAMALAAASQMSGATASAIDNMNNAANQALNEANGNRYNFGSTVIPAGTLTCFSSIDAASTNEATGATDCAATDVAAIQASISAPAPLLFWSLLPGGQTRTTTVASYAVAGMSAPLCTGCGIVPIGVLAPDAADLDNFGFVPGSPYTLYYSCTGTPPQPLAGGGPVNPYVILNRVDPDLDEPTQFVRQGAGGLTGSTIVTPNACTTAPTTPASCVNIGDFEQLPQSGAATPFLCTTTNAQTGVTNLLCGLYSRMSTDALGVCSDYSAVTAAYTADTDAAYVAEPAGYMGNGRRVLTVAVVNAMPTNTDCGAMTVLGFRQFLLNPVSDGTYNPMDPNGRFVALYLGAVAPVPQGWFDTRYAPACRSFLTSGPGKVVLHQ